MTDGSSNLHEPVEKLASETPDLHRALVSLREELEAVDWYRQRADACDDAELKEILEHNMREEMEHAMMLLEWLRRREAHLSGVIQTYIGQKGRITGLEDAAEHGAASADPPPRAKPVEASFTVGSMYKGEWRDRAPE